MNSHIAGGAEGEEEHRADILPFRSPRPRELDRNAPPDSDETLDPEEMDDSENVNWFLSELGHPSLAGRDAIVTAEYIIKYLKPLLPQAQLEQLSDQDFDRRRALLSLSVDSLDLTDEQLRDFAAEDPAYAAMQKVRDSLDKTYPGHLERRQALLALEQLRMGVVIAGIPSDEDKWVRVTQKLATDVRR